MSTQEAREDHEHDAQDAQDMQDMHTTPPAAETAKGDTWVAPYFTRYKRHLAQALALGVLTFIFAAMLMFTSGYLISRCAERPDGGIFVVLVPVAFVQIFGIGKPILRYIERLVSHDWVFRMTSDLRLRLYTALESQAMRLSRTSRTGDFLGLVAEDIGHLQNLYLRTIFPTVIGWVLFALVSIFFGIFDLRFGLAMLVILALVVFALPLISLLVNRARIEREKARKNELYSNLTDNVLGATDWVFSGRGEQYIKTAKAQSEAVHKDKAALDSYYRTNDLVATVILAVGAVVVFVWAASFFGGEGAPRANWIAAFVLGFFPLVEAFMPLTAAVTQVNVYRDSTKRLNEYPTITDNDLGVDPETFDTVSAVRFAIDDLMNQGGETSAVRGTPNKASAAEASSAMTCSAVLTNSGTADSAASAATQSASAVHGSPTEVGFASTDEPISGTNETLADSSTTYDIQGKIDPVRITIKNVAFAYEGEKLVLDGVSIDIAPGSKVAILGRSGSGKSTLARLIRGDEEPTQGEILIDGKPAHELDEAMPHTIGVVQQSAYLFNRTLRENLQIGREDATDEEIWAALDAVELGQMARALPKGLDTMVDEAGMRFSGGERHRITLARVLLSRTGAILLDEPTVGLDPITESALLETLFKIAAHKTLVMITHHLQDIERFDRVIFIEDGKVEMDGSPAELAQTNERFRNLRQFDFGIMVK